MPVDVRGLAPLIQVFDMPASIHFYCDLLGFQIVATSQPRDDYGWALLKLNGVELMLNTAYDAGERPPHPEAARVAAHSDTCLYFGCPDVEAAYQDLRAKGVTLAPPKTAPYGMEQLYFSDPDGYSLCFQWPASVETKAQWRKWYGLK